MTPNGLGTVGFDVIADTYRRDLAYWREVLRLAPAIATISGRRAAAAPAGMGRNRGNLGVLKTNLDGTSLPGPECLMAAYATALRKTFSLEHLIIDRWFSERDTSRFASVLGPFDTFYPVILHKETSADADFLEQITRVDAQARSHPSVDTPALEHELCHFLRERNIALQQFGFGYIHSELAELLSGLETPLDAIASTPHEIQLAAATDETGLQIRLAFDLDIISQDTAQSLLIRTIGELAALTGKAAALNHDKFDWSVHAWPEIEDTLATPETPAGLVGIANIDREVPITSTQAAILSRMAYAEDLASAETAGTFGSAFVVSPSLDRGRMKKAIDTIVARHEIMRTRFVKQGDTFHAYHEREPSQVLFFEEAADEAAAIERAYDLLRDGVRITESLYRIVVISYGAGSDLVVNMAHHIGMDGHSLGLIIEDTFKAMLGMSLPEITMNIDRFVEEFDHVGKPDVLQRRDSYLRELFADPPPVPFIGRKSKGLTPNFGRPDFNNAGRLARTMPPDRQRAIRDRAKLAGTTESAMVMAAYADTLTNLGEVDEVILCVPLSRRHSRSLDIYANLVVTDVPVRVRPIDFQSIEALAAEISRQVQVASEYAPLSDALWTGELRDSLIAQGSYTQLYVAGELTSRRWTQNSISGAFQRPDAQGEIEIGPAKITILPGLREGRLNFAEMDFRSLSSVDGLAIIMKYDTVGFTHVEAQRFLDEVVYRLEAE